MAVGLKEPGLLHPVKGVSLATTAAGIRYQGRDDLLLIFLAEGSTTAAVFTQNKCCAAPVTVAKINMQAAASRALLVNSGNANAVTGDRGFDDALSSCEFVAKGLGIESNSVLPFSTGVIGECLNMAAMQSGVEVLPNQLKEDNWLAAARAIMTTDTLPKAVSKQIDISGNIVTITGITKGSGMICPNMATMLAYVATDADIDQADLELLLRKGVAESFNKITVDSDTSTNDALVLMATGQAQDHTLKGAELEHFYTELEALLVDLATSIIRDGEGATKFVKISVEGGQSNSDCAAIAYSIAHSPLVKTALFASDPNWGRILMALGKAPVDVLDMNKVDIMIGDVSLIEQGQPASSYTEEAGKAVFSQTEILIRLNLNAGSSASHVWTSDLSHEYVSINADYRS
jgi:glutamate N-acetyltransferase/amino-acid N-acetyltransferase